ncbi:hypothetical protein JOF53_004286 [Crossiella equi]|uniref:Uncharacterized protein n=1 Tax=Crossiella equi TaxID=130796 RepID=A0ABS5AFQ4_9PSEU|nr:hypothetical protein [Crossiella equi]MBP2475414.1 hypothetical protein [Crossiella equi]
MTENVNPGNGQPPQPPRRGQVSHQDPSRTSARPPTLAEQRARQEFEQAQAQQRAAELAEAQRKAKLRRGLLIGGGVTVGVVALVAIWYAASQPDDVTARCVDNNNVVVDDDYCDDDYARSHGGHSGSGGIFIYNGGRSYSYNYGGTGIKGQKITGGTSIKPKDANISTASGKTIQRGGFGIRSGGSGGS